MLPNWLTGSQQGQHDGAGDNRHVVLGSALKAPLLEDQEEIEVLTTWEDVGEGTTVVTALEGIARNPQAAGKVQTPMIIGLAMIESLVLFSFVIAFLIQGKIA